ncbi:MAG: hypothetical protein EBQ96_02670 [Proteobacteria bacterium]|nr:hypothetical protein [Pseudomonadota bacterium]
MKSLAAGAFFISVMVVKAAAQVGAPSVTTELIPSDRMPSIEFSLRGPKGEIGAYIAGCHLIGSKSAFESLLSYFSSMSRQAGLDPSMLETTTIPLAIEQAKKLCGQTPSV